MNCIVEIPRVEAVTKPSNPSVSSDSISFDFQTEVPIAPGTEEYYKYLVQYRVRDSDEWQERLPLIDHPNGVTTSRQVLNRTINNLAADTEYEVQVAVCRVWDGVRGECRLSSNSDPIVIIRTGGTTRFDRCFYYEFWFLILLCNNRFYSVFELMSILLCFFFTAT